ncbi:hypothetical protein PMAYCL1PPCAC_24331, partial [Pristionchus mayeri]
EYMLESEVRPESLGFLAKKTKQESYFDVYNRGEMHQIYKIKTNNVKAYTIRPPLFSIGVNERMRVHVTFLGLKDKLFKDRITVLYAHHANVKNTVEQAWYAVKQIINTPQKRAYVTILFKEEQLRSIAEVNEKEAQRLGEGYCSQSLNYTVPPDPVISDSDPLYFATSPKTAKPTVRKRISGPSNYSTVPSEETNEDGNYRGYCTYRSKSKKKNVSQTAEGEEGADIPVPVPPKPRSRRKVAAPSTEEEEEAPSPVTKSAIQPLRRKQTATRVAAAADAAEDEMVEAPRKTRKPVQQMEEEEEAPTKPIHVKPRSRRKTHTPRPPVNEDEEG